MNGTLRLNEAEPVSVVDKQALALRFGKAASQYDDYARLQQEVGHHLLSMIPETTCQKGLDLGCGSGFFLSDLRQLCNDITGLDISIGMLNHARQRYTDAHYLCGDAEQLPLADSCLDLVFSSLALQWCHSLLTALSEIKRVLTPQGHLLFATLSKGSLPELQAAWAAVDGFQHVNEFPDAGSLADTIACSGLQCRQWQVHRHVLWYPDVSAILHSLKGIGASQVVGSRQNGLMTRARLKKMETAYGQQFRNAAGLLPVTYHVCYGVLHR